MSIRNVSYRGGSHGSGAQGRMVKYMEAEKRLRKKSGFFGRVAEAVRNGARKRREDGTSVLADITVFMTGLIFSRCHLVFGSYPLAPAFLAVLPSRVWVALAGACIGALTLGTPGIVYAMIAVIVVFLRIVISGGVAEKRGEEESPRPVFSDRLTLRMSCSVIGGFIAAVYEVLLSGLTLTSVAFGISMILIPPALTLAFAGLFDGGIDFREFFRGKGNLSLSGLEAKKKYAAVFFQFAALVFTFFISLSLREYELFGISSGYIFASAAALFVARRYGALRGGAIGFVAALPHSALYSAAYALLGVSAGVLYSLGIAYALIGGGVVVSLWCAYTGGVYGFLGVFPEYCLASIVCFPLLRRLGAMPQTQENDEPVSGAADMVGTMALSYRNRCERRLDGLECALSSLSSEMHEAGERDAKPTDDEYMDILLTSAARASGRGADDGVLEKLLSPAFTRLCAGACVDAGELLCVIPDPASAATLADEINAAVRALRQSKAHPALITAAEEYRLFAKALSEARAADASEREVDSALSEKLGDVMTRHGIRGGVIRAFGDRAPHLIAAGEDADGSIMSSVEFIKDMEETAGIRLGAREYYRRGGTVLMECSSESIFTAESAYATAAGEGGEISGDSVSCFETADGRFFAIVSDGMGRGSVAHDTSGFCISCLSRLLSAGCGKNTALEILNSLIRQRTGECSATVDLFEFDLVTGSASFWKSGAAPSFVKRGDSLFRIKSRTLPIGLLDNVDAERVRVDVRPEDYVIMISDGVSQSPDESPWLLGLLGAAPVTDPSEYAKRIIAAAKKNGGSRDDMTAVVVRLRAGQI